MEKNTTTDVTLKIKDYEAHTVTATQYGMRYPDGLIKWVDDEDKNNRPVNFHDLQARSPRAVMNWEEKLRSKAEYSRVDLDTYTAQHQLLKRTVIIVTTTAEEA